MEFLTYPFIQKAFLGGIAIALCCGLLGPFLVLRKQSLLGDGLAHLAFGGIALGFLFGINPLWSSLISAFLGSWAIQRMIKRKLYGDAAIALLLSLGVGTGMVVLSLTERLHLGLYNYFLGNVLALSFEDLALIYGVTAINLLLLWRFYPTWFFLAFNQELGELQNRTRPGAEFLFTVAAALTVVISIQAVGILLVSALLVIPALIALGSARSFKETLFLSTLIGVLGVVAGILIAYAADIPPAGAIVLFLFTIYALISGLKQTSAKYLS